MTYRKYQASCLFLVVCAGAPGVLRAQNAIPAGSAMFSHDFTRSPHQLPNLFRPYQPQQVPPPVLENSPRLKDLIHNGRLEISLADALALALENNLDIAVQRYLRPVAQSDVLRTRSGQAARGVPGALMPGALNTGAIGVGVNQAAGGGGVGSAGGITGGGGAISVPQVGTFDPALSFNFSFDRNVSPLNTTKVAGVPTVTTDSVALSGSYTQLLPNGFSYFASVNGLRQITNQQFLQFNPAVISRFSTGFNQPLLSGRGFVPNERFLFVALNNLKTSDQIFRLQVITTVVSVENAYWDLAAATENVKVSQESLAVAQTLNDNNEKKLKAGLAAPLDVVTSQAQVAAAQRDVVVAQTNLQLSQNQLKNMLSKRRDADLDAAQVVVTDQMPQPQDADVPELQKAIETAWSRRAELIEAQNDLQNQDIGVQFSRNAMLPQASLFGLYAGAGLQGNSLLGTAGTGASLSQAFGAAFPEYGSGANFVAYLGNRSAQADNLRAQLEANQLQVGLARSRQQVNLEVRQAVTGLVQGKAQVAAAREAAELARQVLDAERKKLAEGISTPYDVVLRQRDLVTAQQAEISAVAGYAKALVEMDRSTGTILDHDNIDLEDAHTGTVTHRPAPPLRYPRFPGVGGGTASR